MKQSGRVELLVKMLTSHGESLFNLVMVLTLEWDPLVLAKEQPSDLLGVIGQRRL